jgi:hypothetical protein
MQPLKPLLHCMWGFHFTTRNPYPSHTPSADFEAARRVFLSNCTEADFQNWRDERDWTAEKYRRFDRGERMPAD